jgi:dihydroflavonol-4-reductase
VHTSSIVAVGAAATGVPATEDSPWNLDAVKVDYVHAKKAAEELVLESAGSGRDAVVVNPSFLIGPEDYEGSGLTRFCLRFWKGRAPFAPPGGLNLVDVRDVAAGHILAAERGRPGHRYLLGGENLTFPQILQLLADVGGLRPRSLPRMPWWLLRTIAGLAQLRSRFTGRPAFPAVQEVRLNRYSWFCSSARAISELGFRPRPVIQALADLHDWLAQQGKLLLRGVNRWWMRPCAVRDGSHLPIA